MQAVFRHLFGRFLVTAGIAGVLGLSAGVLHAQPSNLRFRHFDSDDGLHSTVFSILQDRQGFMWFAHSGGLSVYDGYRFVTHNRDPDDPGSLRATAVTLAEDREGVLWIATLDGLSRFDPTTGRYTHYLHDAADPASLSNNRVRDVLEDREGTIWAFTIDGVLHRLDQETARFDRFPLETEYLLPLGYSSVTKMRLRQDSRGQLWVGAWGLHRFDPDTEHFDHYLPDRRYPVFDADDLASRVNAITAIERDGEHGLWIGTAAGGLRRFDLDAITFTHVYMHDPGDATSLGHDRVLALLPDGSTGLWVGTYAGGLDYFDRASKEFTHYRHREGDPNSIGHNTVRAIQEDRQGGLWVGTWGGGVSYFDRFKRGGFLHYKHDPANPARGLSINEIYGIQEDRDGMLWVATVGDGLNRLDRRTGLWTHFRHDPADPSSPAGDDPVNFLLDRDGLLWIGTTGLDSFDPNTQKFVHYPSVGDVHIVYLHEDRYGVLWLAAQDGVYRFDKKTGTVLSRYRHDPNDPTSISASGAAAILEDHAGTIWIASKGLNRFDREKETFSHFIHDENNPNSLADNTVFHIQERRKQPGVLWISTYGGGLNRFDVETGDFTRFTEQNSDLPSNLVNACLEDEHGRLWISTEKGLARFNPETETFKGYDLKDGLQSLEFDVQSFHRSESGEMFFGGVNGLNAFFPDQIRDNPHPPQVALTDFKLFNESVVIDADGSPLRQHISATETITLEHNQNDFSFEYVGLHYSYPDGIRYAYLLQPYDDEWREVGTQRAAYYTSLPAGNYSFRVKAASSDGVWNEESVAVQLTILPPWWRTSWAHIAYGLFLLAGVFAVHRLQRRRLIRSERERSMRLELDHGREIQVVNERLRAHELQLEDQNRELLALDETKNRFFANISHEFRTPLTLILGPLNDVLSAARKSNHLLRQAPSMRRSAQRLLRLINQLLDLSRLEAGVLHLNTQPTDLNQHLRRLVLAFRARADREGISLLYKRWDTPVVGSIDRDKFEKVIVNLLSNALKFTPNGGSVEVALRVAPRSLGDGEASTCDWVEIVINDTGPGIVQEALPRIFDRFYQVDSSSTRAHGGSGIGLALTKELVELHGGSIEVTSEFGAGATFTLSLPMGSVEAAADDDVGGLVEQPCSEDVVVSILEEDTCLLEDETSVPNCSLRGSCILVVEDDADMRQYVSGLLREEGYRVEEASNGRRGLDRARKVTPDLIVSDIMMPELDGVELCREIKASTDLGHVPVVLLTAKAAEEDKLEALGAGADDYLRKPFSTDELLVRAENLIEIRRRLRDASSEFSRMRAGAQMSVRDAGFVEAMEAVVMAHLDSSGFTIEQLADELALSVRQMYRRTKSAVGLTPAGYVRMIRLREAALYLRRGAGNVSEAAYAVGFSDVDHFSRLFKQTHGVSPSRYGADEPAESMS